MLHEAGNLPPVYSIKMHPSSEDSDVDELLAEMVKIGDLIQENPHVKALLHYMQLGGVSVYTMRMIYHELSAEFCPWSHMVGMVLMLSGYAGWISARIALGNLFAIRPQAQGLVKTGIYSIIRNPIYVFGTIYFVGLGIYSDISWWVLASAISVVVYAQSVRSVAEAKVLRAYYPEEYNQYEKDVWI